MSDVPDHNRTDRPWYAQPAPSGGTGVIVQQLVVDDLVEREWYDLARDAVERWEFGCRKYGNEGLRPGDGRSTDADAYAECLDLVMYCRKGIAEGAPLADQYRAALALARSFRDRLAEVAPW